MAGLIGILHSVEAAVSPASWQAAAVAGVHSPALAVMQFKTAGNIRCAAMYHRRDESGCDSAEDDRYFVAIYGQIYPGEDSHVRLTAGGILELLRGKGQLSLDRLSGSYQLFVVDRIRQQAIVQNDRQAKMPLYFVCGYGWFAFAPQAKCFFAAGLLEPEVDGVSAACFLREGFVLPRKSIFRHVERLAPGQRLTIELPAMRAKIDSYCSVRFGSAVSIGLDEAADELYRRLESSHRRDVAEAEGAFGLFLTGGLDSRGIAGTLAGLGALPVASVTWCGRAAPKGSDPDIAAKIANHYKFSHRVVPLDPDDFCTHAANWVHVSELANDITGFMLERADVFNGDETRDVQFMLVGDEMFGHGHEPQSREESTRFVLKSAYHDPKIWLRGCLNEEMGLESDAAFNDAVSLATSGRSVAHRDTIDLLTYGIHRPSWSFSPGNSREVSMPIRRPLLNDEVISFVAQLPTYMRNDKLIYYHALKRHLPQVSRFPRVTADSLFNWANHFRLKQQTKGFLIDSIQHGLLDSTHMRGILNSDGVLALMAEFFTDDASPTSPRRSYRAQAVNIRRLTGRIPGLKGLTRAVSRNLRRGARQTAATPAALIKRLAMLGMLVDQIESGRFDPPR